MSEKVIGVLGGMGPEATLSCFEKIIRNTPAGSDQEHFRVVIDNNPKVPDRIKAILEDGESPLPVLIDGCRSLERAGADFAIIPCVTVHYFLEQLKESSPLPILSILDVVVDYICRHHPKMNKFGLMATNGTVQSGIFQKRLAQAGLDCIVCPPDTQKQVIAAILDIKKTIPTRSREIITADLAAATEKLVELGAEGIIAGCTEIPLYLQNKDVRVPYFDSLLILALASIHRAGHESE